MDAILLVGGFGTRLLPLTKTVPKPLIPLANVAFVERTVAWLRDAGATNVIMSLHYSAEQFIEYFRDKEMGVSLAFALEETPLGTGGAIKNCEPYLRSHRCVVCNGDIFTSLRLPAMLREHLKRGAAISIALKEVEDPSRFGVIETDPTSRILAFTEKPPRELARSREINTGIYLFERAVFDWLPAKRCSVERDIFPQLLAEHIHLAGYREHPYWTDLGAPHDYLQAHRDILLRRVPVTIPAREAAPGLWLGENVRVAPEARIRPPVLLGDGVIVERGAVVGPNAVLGTGAVIGTGASVTESVLWEQAVLKPRSEVTTSVIGRGAIVDGYAYTALCEDGGTYPGETAAEAA